MSVDRTALWAVATAIAFPIVGDRPRTTDLATRSLAWLEEQPAAADDPLPWLASHVVAEAIVDPPVPGRTNDARRAHLAAALRAEPVAAQVAFALHVLCGYDLPTTATLCRRSAEDIETLLAPLEPATTGIEVLAEPTAPERPKLFSSLANAETAAATEPEPTPEPATESGPTPPKRRWFRPRGGTAATILLVAFSIVVVTYPGGARPSFADPPVTTHCGVASGGNIGPGTVSTVSVGPDHRPARLFVPAGTAVGRSVVLLIGDGGSSPEATVATTGMESAAATQGFVLVTLDGTNGAWNAGDNLGGAKDRPYAVAAIDRAGTTGCADTSRVAIVGYGTGAHMAAALACDPTIHTRQLVMVRGADLPTRCAPAGPLSVLIDVDKYDTVLPNSGGWGSTAPTPGYVPTSVEAAYSGWAQIEGCGTTSTGEAEPSGLVVSSKAGCPSGTQVVARITSGQGHGWPAEAVGATVRFISSR